MKMLECANFQVYEYMCGVDFKHWARHVLDHHVKSDQVTNNMLESTNNWVSKLQEQPILQVCENLRRRTMKVMRKQLEFAKLLKTMIPLNVLKEVERTIYKGRYINVLTSSETEFKVRDEGTTNL